MLRHRITSKGAQLWCQTDGVHMSKDAYADLAHVVLEAAQGDDTGDAASGISGSSKRKVPDSVVTLPRAAKSSRLQKSVRKAGWLHGLPDSRPTGNNWRGWPSRGLRGRGGTVRGGPPGSGWRRQTRWRRW
jgi:hypothetical protein